MRAQLRRAAASVPLLAACAGAPPAEERAATPGLQPLRRLLQEFDSGLTDSARVVVTDSAAWGDVWRRAYTRRGDPPARPEVDFSREIVVVVALGTRSSGGHSILVDSARVTGEALEVFVRSVFPGPTCGTTAALTEPAAAVAVPRTTLPVRFIERRESTDCG